MRNPSPTASAGSSRPESTPSDPEHEQDQRHQDQRNARDPLRPLAKLLAEPAAQPEAYLRRDERLNADPKHRQKYRKAKQPGAQPDRELVEADAEAEVED